MQRISVNLHERKDITWKKKVALEGIEMVAGIMIKQVKLLPYWANLWPICSTYSPSLC